MPFKIEDYLIISSEKLNYKIPIRTGSVIYRLVQCCCSVLSKNNVDFVTAIEQVSAYLGVLRFVSRLFLIFA